MDGKILAYVGIIGVAIGGYFGFVLGMALEIHSSNEAIQEFQQRAANAEAQAKKLEGLVFSDNACRK